MDLDESTPFTTLIPQTPRDPIVIYNGQAALRMAIVEREVIGVERPDHGGDRGLGDKLMPLFVVSKPTLTPRGCAASGSARPREVIRGLLCDNSADVANTSCRKSSGIARRPSRVAIAELVG